MIFLYEWAAFAIMSAVLMSIFRVIQKKVLSTERSLEFSAATSAYRLPILILMLFFINVFDLNWKIVAILYILSLLRTVAAFWRLRATKHLQLSVVEPLYNLYPLFVVVISYFILGEKITFVQGAGILVLLFGAYFLETTKDKKILDVLKSFFKSKMVILGILSVLLFSFTGVLDKFMLNSGVTVAKYFILLFIFISINFIVCDIFMFGFKDVWKSVRTSSLFTFLAAIFHMTSLLFYFISLSFPGAMVSLVSPIRTSSVLFTTVIGGAIYHEDHIKQKAIAAVIMFVGATLIILG